MLLEDSCLSPTRYFLLHFYKYIYTSNTSLRLSLANLDPSEFEDEYSPVAGKTISDYLHTTAEWPKFQKFLHL